MRCSQHLPLFCIGVFYYCRLSTRKHNNNYNNGGASGKSLKQKPIQLSKPNNQHTFFHNFPGLYRFSPFLVNFPGWFRATDTVRQVKSRHWNTNWRRQRCQGHILWWWYPVNYLFRRNQQLLDAVVLNFDLRWQLKFQALWRANERRYRHRPFADNFLWKHVETMDLPLYVTLVRARLIRLCCTDPACWAKDVPKEPAEYCGKDRFHSDSVSDKSSKWTKIRGEKLWYNYSITIKTIDN